MTIFASQALLRENKKKSSIKILHQWELNLDLSHAGPMLLSEPLRQVLLGRAIVMLYWFSLNDLGPTIEVVQQQKTI